MKYLAGLIAFVALSFPAYAQEEIPQECLVLPEHKANADVAYKSGVDVNGKPVVPADLNSSAIGTNDTITIPLSIDLAQRLQGMNVPGLDMTTTLGFLEISPDGRVIYNGQDMTSQVYVLCGRKVPELPAYQAPSDAPAADGQMGTDTVKSAPVKEIKPAAPASAPTPAPAPAPKPAPKPVEKGELLEGQDSRDQ